MTTKRLYRVEVVRRVVRHAWAVSCDEAESYAAEMLDDAAPQLEVDVTPVRPWHPKPSPEYVYHDDPEAKIDAAGVWPEASPDDRD